MQDNVIRLMLMLCCYEGQGMVHMNQSSLPVHSDPHAQPCVNVVLDMTNGTQADSMAPVQGMMVSSGLLLDLGSKTLTNDVAQPI